MRERETKRFKKVWIEQGARWLMGWGGGGAEIEV